MALGTILARLSVGAISKSIENVVDLGDNIAKMADATGLSVEAFQALRSEAVEQGVRLEKFQKILVKFNYALGEAGQGMATYRDAFVAAGVKIADGTGALRKAEDVLSDLLETVSSGEFGVAEKTSILGRLFGSRDAGQVSNFARSFRDIEGGISGIISKQRGLQTIIPEEAVRNAEEIRNTLDQIERRMSVKMTEAMGKFLPLIVWWKNLMVDIVGLMGEAVETIHKENAFERAYRLEQGLDTRREVRPWAANSGPQRPEEALASVSRVTVTVDKAVSDLTEQRLEGLKLAEQMFWDAELDQLELEEEHRAAMLAKRIEAERKAAEVTEKLAEDTDHFAETLDSNLSRTFQNVLDGTMKVEDAFLAMISNILAELTQRHVTEPFANLLSSGLSSLAGSFGGFGVAPTTAPTGRIISTFPARAMGGPVAAGQPYMVGESGREMFVPKQAGRLLSHGNSMAKSDGGGSVVVNQSIHVTAGVAQTVRAEMTQLMPQIARMSQDGVLDAKRRGGSFARAFA